MKTIIKLIVGAAVVLAGMSAGAASATQDTTLPADGVTSLEYTDAGWTITLASADASEVKLISPTQEIACSEHEGKPKNGHPLCDSTTYTFSTNAECVMIQVDWTDNVHNSSDPQRCQQSEPTHSPSPTATVVPSPSATPTTIPSPMPTASATSAATATAVPVVVMPAVPDTPGAELAATGGEWVPWLILGLILISIGLAILIARATNQSEQE